MCLINNNLKLDTYLLISFLLIGHCKFEIYSKTYYFEQFFELRKNFQ